MKREFIEILSNAQQGPVNHKKYISALQNIYKAANFDEFSGNLLFFLQGILQRDFKNKYVKIVLDFIAKFIGHICEQQNAGIVFPDSEPISNPLLSQTLEFIVQYHGVDNENCRYNTCNFISLLLTYMSRDTRLDNNLCDLIETTMLENIKDPKPSVRVQAVLALVRLQDPLNPDCPVIHAFLSCLRDPSALVRREAVKRIAPNALTIPKIKDRTRDINENVRCAAFIHCGDLGLTQFRIIHRQHILRSGFDEKNRVVKKMFSTYLLPKWLSSVNGEYLTFFNAIRLDTDETDLLNTARLSKDLMDVFVKTEPVLQLIEALPLSRNKLISVDKVDCETSFYWDVLSTHLRKIEDMEEYLEMLIPELTAFCNYIDEVIIAKTPKAMNEVEYENLSCMLYYLLNIVEGYDFSDEVGRNALGKLNNRLLGEHWLQEPLLKKIVRIQSKLITDKSNLAEDIANIITDKRNPVVEKPCPRDHSEELQMAKLKVELLCLKGDLETAVDDKDFQKAALLENKIREVNIKLDALNAPGQVEIVRSVVTKNDSKTVCWCLDLLTVTVAYGGFKKIPSCLLALREDFVKPLHNHKDLEIQWRYFKCILSFSMFDIELAKESLKYVITNIVSYQVVPNFSKEIVVCSVHAVSDFLRIYNPKLFGINEDEGNATTVSNTTRRRFYDQDGKDIGDVSNEVSLEILLNVILDMLDDETEELRDAAVTAYAKLMLNGLYITPTVMARFVLKWYNPATGILHGQILMPKTKKNRKRTDLLMQQKIGTIIGELTERIQDAKGIIAKAIVPVIRVLASAPKTSPLFDVDADNILNFLGTITKNGPNAVDFPHRELLHLVLNEISSKPSDPATPYFAKLLLNLVIDISDMVVVTELTAQAKLIYELDELDHSSKQSIRKFTNMLQGIITNHTVTSSVREESRTESIHTTEQPNNKNLVVVLTNCISGDTRDENCEDKSKRSGSSNINDDTDTTNKSNNIVKSPINKRRSSRGKRKKYSTSQELNGSSSSNTSGSPRCQIKKKKNEQVLEPQSSNASSSSSKDSTLDNLEAKKINNTRKKLEQELSKRLSNNGNIVPEQRISTRIFSRTSSHCQTTSDSSDNSKLPKEKINATKGSEAIVTRSNQKRLVVEIGRRKIVNSSTKHDERKKSDESLSDSQTISESGSVENNVKKGSRKSGRILSNNVLKEKSDSESQDSAVRMSGGRVQNHQNKKEVIQNRLSKQSVLKERPDKVDNNASSTTAKTRRRGHLEVSESDSSSSNQGSKRKRTNDNNFEVRSSRRFNIKVRRGRGK